MCCFGDFMGLKGVIYWFSGVVFDFTFRAQNCWMEWNLFCLTGYLTHTHNWFCH